jgi:hypothetical protein
MVISLELMLLSIGLFMVNISFALDDLIGATLTLYLLPFAGAESAIALALLVAFSIVSHYLLSLLTLCICPLPCCYLLLLYCGILGLLAIIILPLELLVVFIP